MQQFIHLHYAYTLFLQAGRNPRSVTRNSQCSQNAIIHFGAVSSDLYIPAD